MSHLTVGMTLTVCYRRGTGAGSLRTRGGDNGFSASTLTGGRSQTLYSDGVTLLASL